MLIYLFFSKDLEGLYSANFNSWEIRKEREENHKVKQHAYICVCVYKNKNIWSCAILCSEAKDILHSIWKIQTKIETENRVSNNLLLKDFFKSRKLLYETHSRFWKHQSHRMWKCKIAIMEIKTIYCVILKLHHHHRSQLKNDNKKQLKKAEI